MKLKHDEVTSNYRAMDISNLFLFVRLKTSLNSSLIGFQ